MPIYSNQFAVYVPSGREAADEIAQEHGFDNHGQVSVETSLLSDTESRARFGSVALEGILPPVSVGN